jgi:L-seryl-tRNA(Ser) seleniumtransferase
MKLLAAAPLLSQIAARGLYAQAASAMGHDPRQNIYTRLGVKTIINCRGTWTYLSGSLEFPEVRQAQVEAAQHFVNMLELQRAVGKRLAELTGAESGIITSGAAGAMAAATAACMAGADDKHIWQLPDTTGLKHEVIMVGGRSAFDSAIRLTGAKLVLTYSPEELVNAINDNTAMIYTTDLGDKLKNVLSIAKDHKVPMLLDDAAGIPPADNAKLYARMGIDMYCFSGGKGLCGPQCSGLLLGRKDLIEAALLNCSPREGAVCRPMKVGKEEIIGCLTALETWLNLDEKKIYAEWNERIDRIRKLVETVRNRSPWRRQSEPGHHSARGQSHSQRAQGAGPHRTGFYDHQARRRNDCRAAAANDSRHCPEEISGIELAKVRSTVLRLPPCDWLDFCSSRH